MCGRFTMHTPLDRLQRLFPGWKIFEGIGARYNIAPMQEVLAARNDGRRVIEPLRWGLIPFWAKDPAIGSRMINARVETVAERPAFRGALRRRRCLVLADGYYEWQKSGRGKIPFYITMKSGEPFAGLWESWGPEEHPLRSCTIIVGPANHVTAPIHDRMPVVLHREDYAAWLAPEEQKPENLLPMLQPYPSEEMRAWPVSTAVNSPRNDAPELIERITP